VTSQTITNIFYALSQESRLNIFKLLIEYGNEGLCAGEIAKKLEITKNTLSFHLLLLNKAGLVNRRKKGTFAFYSANFDTVQDIIDFLTEDCCRRTKNHKHNHTELKVKND
jgi:DNA-binding transcriptional ArsR family regulator